MRKVSVFPACLSADEIIKKISESIKEKVVGDVYCVSLTKPGMNVKVARVLLTGDIQKLNYPIISDSKEMFEFGIRCGYSDKKTTCEELFWANTIIKSFIILLTLPCSRET